MSNNNPLSAQRRADRALRTAESPWRMLIVLAMLVGGCVWVTVDNLRQLSATAEIVVIAGGAVTGVALAAVSVTRLRRLSPQSTQARRANIGGAQLLAAPAAGVGLILADGGGHLALALIGAIGAGFFLGGAPILLVAASRNARSRGPETAWTKLT